MDTPKTIYTQCEASRLCDHPCIYCGKTGRISIRLVPDLDGSIDRKMSVLWYCLAPLYEGHDGFSIESQ